MKNENILITGGFGFVGSHLCKALLSSGYKIRVLDNLIEQVHGKNPLKNISSELVKNVEFINGDIRNPDLLEEALRGVSMIFHYASRVGVSQSMYEIKDYTDVNVLGTANLFSLIIKNKLELKKLIIASSMTVYGEGDCKCNACGEFSPEFRSEQQLLKRDWEIKCPKCNKNSIPIPSCEDKKLNPSTIYAITKRDQEEMALCIGKAYNIPTTVFRFFNIYGPGQSLSNPYTGVLAIFASRILNGNPPVIYEDGLQSRDFIHVDDVVSANLLALESSNSDYEIFNVGSGKPTSIRGISDLLAKKLMFKDEPVILNKFRKGDIRHCIADISKIRKKINFDPKRKLEDEIDNIVTWIKSQKAVDMLDKACNELEKHGLTK